MTVDPYYAVFEILEELMPDMSYYLLGRIATAVADFGIPQDRVLYWIHRSKISTCRCSYLHRCLVNELNKRGISLEDLDKARTRRQTNFFICPR